MKTNDLDILEERDELEEAGEKLTTDAFYKSNSTVDLEVLNKIRKSRANLPPKQLSGSGSSHNQMKSTAQTLNR
jgi:hypothetical protein